MEMLDQCAVHLKRGSPLLLFPEGTRSPDGRLRAFKEGAFAIALEAGCPVIPIAVHGTEHVLPKHGFFFGRMRAHAEVLQPIDSRSFGSVEALRDAAHDAIQAALTSKSGEEHTGATYEGGGRPPRLERPGLASHGTGAPGTAHHDGRPRSPALWP
jgi:1-acyl-sn-glycerol-3-phosphate acyltransferase